MGRECYLRLEKKGVVEMKRALIIANGQWEDDQDFFYRLIDEIDILVCADGGAKYALQLGLKPERIYGDLDSLDLELEREYRKMGVEFCQFPVIKDKTDTHLVIDHLIDEGFKEILLAGALGGRVDHFLGNLMLLSYGHKKKVQVKLISPTVEVQLLEGSLQISGHQGDTFSLIPLDEVVKGVTLEGFKYPLIAQDVYRESTLGISNLIIAEEATVSIEQGRAFIFIVAVKSV